MTALAPLAPRLAPLLGKLASPHDAEVIGAARAAGRLLEKAGLSFNDLGRALTEPRERIVFVERPPEPKRPPAPDPRDWRRAAAWCLDRAALLSDTEHGFVWQLAAGQWRKPTLTRKQADWLAAIVARLQASEDFA